MITKFENYSTEKDIEIKDVIETLKEFSSSYEPPEYDSEDGWVSMVKPEKVSSWLTNEKGNNIIDAIREYLRWVYRFDDEDDIKIDVINIQPLYNDLGVYNKTKKMMTIRFHTERFAQSKHTFRKGEFEIFIEFMKDPDFFKEQRKFNL